MREKRWGSPSLTTTLRRVAVSEANPTAARKGIGSKQ
jgi:hypothetical protein